MTLDIGAFTLSRSFAVPPQRLWDLLTDAEARRLWGGPDDNDVLVVDEHDVREGGTDRHRCGPKDAPDYSVMTRWYRLDAPRLACFTETVDAGGARIATTLVTYALSAEGAGTLLEISVQGSSFVGSEALADFEAGWTSALARLGRQIEEGAFEAVP